MKWIGQHIWSLISRFRSDVYLESLATTTDSNVLVVDASGKVGKNTSGLLVLGTSDTTALAGDTTTITSGQTSAISANTLKETNVVQTTITGNAATATALTSGDKFIDGNIGIGTTTPTSLLEISSTSETDFLKLTSAGGGATPIKLIFEKSAAEQGVIEYNRNGDLEIYNTDNDGGVLIDGSTSAGSDFYVSNTGKVGIGTDTPVSALHVLATTGVVSESPSNASITIRRNDNVAYSALLKYHTGNSEKWVAGLSDSGDFTGSTGNEYFIGTSKTSPSLLVNSSGKVGIGDTSPNHKLVVATPNSNDGIALQTTLGTDVVKLLNGNSDGFPVGKIAVGYGTTSAGILSGGSNTLSIRGGGSSGGKISFSSYLDEIMRVTSTGLGIGTTTPAEKLDVVGNIKASGEITADSITTSGNGGTLLRGDLHITRTDSQPSEIRFDTNRSFGRGFSLVTNGLTPSIVADHSLLIGTTNTDTQIKLEGGSNTDNIQFYSNEVEQMRITTTGVGIGTGSPSEKLDVVGNIKASGDITSTGNLNINGAEKKLVLTGQSSAAESTITASSFIYQTDDDGAAYPFTSVGNLVLQSRQAASRDIVFITGTTPTTKMALKGDGKLGIGIDAPTEKLHVNGNGIITGTLDVQGGFADSIIISGLTPEVIISTTDSSIYDGDEFGKLEWKMNDANSGGTTITGNIQMIFNDQVSTGPAQATVGEGADMIFNTGKVAVTGQPQVMNEAMRIDKFSNVGIGTTTPSEKLDVAGNIKADRIYTNVFRDTNGNGFITTQVLNASNTETTFANAGTTNTLTFNTKTSGKSIFPNGNVGIGTITPSEKLDVVGNIAVSGTVELGHASDTTIARSAAGIVTIEGARIKTQELFIKILPSNFIADNGGRPLAIDDSSSNRWLESHGTHTMFASVEIPLGFKATHIHIYGDGTSAMTVYRADIDGRAIVGLGTGNIGTNLAITNTTANSTNYILIQLAQTSGEQVNGGIMTIAPV